MSKSTAETPSVPAGKVGCLLCGGFISVQGGDRARFIDHMSNEHDAKNESHEVLLALCVMDTKEKGFLVKSSGARLEQVGKGQGPDYSNSFLTKFSMAPQQVPPAPAPRQSVPQYRRGRGATGTQIRPLPPRQPSQAPPVQPAPSPRAAPPPPVVNMPNVLRGNGSISISKVDQTKKCTMCATILPNPAALREHMNREHLSILGGVVVASGEDKRLALNSRPAQEVKMQTPNTYLAQGLTSGVQLRSPASALALNRSLPSPVTPRPPASFQRAFPNSGSRVSRPRSPAVQNIRTKQPADLAKCNICGKSVEKSKLAIHKMSHSGDRKVEKSNLNRSSLSSHVGPNTLKRKMEDGVEHGANAKEKMQDDQEVELIEIDLDDSNESSMKNSPLPHTSFKKDYKLGNGNSDIQCDICKKKLASNMALKMHNNLKHPIKKEVDDAEMLLEEENDNMNKSTDVKENDDVKNEIEKMETLELLDNLVNFLNDA